MGLRSMSNNRGILSTISVGGDGGLLIFKTLTLTTWKTLSNAKSQTYNLGQIVLENAKSMKL